MARQGSQSPAGSSNSPAQVRGIGVQKTEIRSAPLPDPEELGRYRDLDPALYELIKTEYAKNGQHRRLIEAEFSATQKALVRGVTRNDMLGIFASWTFAMVFVLGAFYFMNKGLQNATVIAGLGALPAIIAALRRTMRR